VKIISIIGTRPEIIKMSPLFELLDKNFKHRVVHSGQHYDAELDTEIFKELKLKQPAVRLKTGSGDFSTQINKQIKSLYAILLKEKPDYVIVQGDTNTALSGAIVAARLKIKVIHVEAGCRSGNLGAPEEQNRLLIDSIASLHLCPDNKSYESLKAEGKLKSTHLVGSTVFDAVSRSSKIAPRLQCKKYEVEPNRFILATLHRSESMDDLKGFIKKISFLNWMAEFMPVIFPMHPRTKLYLQKNKIDLSPKILKIKPLKHLPFISLLKDCHLVITDSGGIQEEAAFFNRPCLILRNETEWMRLVKSGKNFLLKNLGNSDYELAKKLIMNKEFYNKARKKKAPESKGGAAKKIINIIKKMKTSAI
jgi:UDP-N-acetylglucosamine 2-epimerase (non-hydrolysing)